MYPNPTQQSQNPNNLHTAHQGHQSNYTTPIPKISFLEHTDLGIRIAHIAKLSGIEITVLDPMRAPGVYAIRMPYGDISDFLMAINATSVTPLMGIVKDSEYTVIIQHPVLDGHGSDDALSIVTLSWVMAGVLNHRIIGDFGGYRRPFEPGGNPIYHQPPHACIDAFAYGRSKRKAPVVNHAQIRALADVRKCPNTDIISDMAIQQGWTPKEMLVVVAEVDKIEAEYASKPDSITLPFLLAIMRTYRHRYPTEALVQHAGDLGWTDGQIASVIDRLSLEVNDECGSFRFSEQELADKTNVDRDPNGITMLFLTKYAAQANLTVPQALKAHAFKCNWSEEQIAIARKRLGYPVDPIPGSSIEETAVEMLAEFTHELGGAWVIDDVFDLAAKRNLSIPDTMKATTFGHQLSKEALDGAIKIFRDIEQARSKKPDLITWSYLFNCHLAVGDSIITALYKHAHHLGWTEEQVKSVISRLNLTTDDIALIKPNLASADTTDHDSVKKSDTITISYLHQYAANAKCGLLEALKRAANFHEWSYPETKAAAVRLGIAWE